MSLDYPFQQSTCGSGTLGDNNSMVVGTCSLCAGAVMSERVVINDGRPHYDWCATCGATTRPPQFGPIITMYPKRKP